MYSATDNTTSITAASTLSPEIVTSRVQAVIDALTGSIAAGDSFHTSVSMSIGDVLALLQSLADELDLSVTTPAWCPECRAYLTLGLGTRCADCVQVAA